ncbi:hypothetical protein PIB30_046906 [Stylosanthes scabra]|uniref:Uncharacterized protein n=1 Tax=Stylosanthes scabra TaxID=79078 RepID=A0ABU6VIH9_9FABA|nr:hypothetical protein [Stylosanthes scabra]
MASKGKGVASTSTPSRSRTTKNSNQGRDESFPTERFDSQIHYDRWKTMERRGITHEQIIRFLDGEPDFLHERVEGIGRWIPFSEDDIRRFLGIDIDLPPPGEDDMYKMRVPARENDELDMDLVYQVIGRPGNNWANEEFP